MAVLSSWGRIRFEDGKCYWGQPFAHSSTEIDNDQYFSIVYIPARRKFTHRGEVKHSSWYPIIWMCDFRVCVFCQMEARFFQFNKENYLGAENRVIFCQFSTLKINFVTRSLDSLLSTYYHNDTFMIQRRELSQFYCHRSWRASGFPGYMSFLKNTYFNIDIL